MDECELSDCHNKLDGHDCTITFKIENLEKTIKVCRYHHALVSVTSGFSIGSDQTLKPIPVQKGI